MSKPARTQVLTERGEFLGEPILHYVCSADGFATSTVRREHESLARMELGEHFTACHEPEMTAAGFGACGRCGAFTDHLRINAGPHRTTWLCADCAPSEQLRAVLGGQQ